MAEFEVVVIGSGAGGAPVAHELARAGKGVVVLEKGPLLRPQYQTPDGVSDFKRDEMFATGPEKRITVEGMANRGESFYSSHVEPDLNDEPHVYRGPDDRDRATIEGYTAQVVGGGTQLYGAVSLRFFPEDFTLASFNRGRTDLREDPRGDIQRETRDWPFTYDQLESYYAKAERLIGINGTVAGQRKPFSADHYQKPVSPNPISTYVEAGMDALGLRRYRTPLAVITEDHAPSGRSAPSDPDTVKTAFVNRYGDPLGLKSNTWVSLLSPVADLPNFQLRPNSHVTHLASRGDRVTTVHYVDGAGRPREVSADLVVVACSAIESVRLLKLSAQAGGDFAERIDGNGLLGAYFLTHCFGGAEARMPRRYDKALSLDSDWATDAGGEPDFLREHGLWAGATMYNNTSDQALPISLARTHGAADLDTVWKVFVNDNQLVGEAMNRWLDADLGTRLSVSFMANQVPLRSNRIELHPSVSDKWGRPVAYILKQWHAHDRYLMDVMARRCADIIKAGSGVEPESPGGAYMAENALARIANHILGGARFGTDPGDSVLDPTCRAWQFDNLYVTDGSCMPTSGGANPTLTIQANAFRVADHLLQRL
ncbi:MAG: GMC family oxidoreductase [Actinomycetota bacterium]|nr:GMC family oxidoreductase [Actinomycetota bacterium]